MELPSDIEETVARALFEDIRDGDVTAMLINEATQAAADVICREDAVLCGTAWFDAVFKALDADCVITWHRRDGDSLANNMLVCAIEGKARALVTGERTALNFLQTLSGTASATRHYAAQIKATTTKLLDTRKTIPGLRTAQKYAVLCGGAKNHRIGLFDAILIKENHIEAAGSIEAAIAGMRGAYPQLNLEIEVESLADLKRALHADADMVLLDNFSNDMLREAVAITAGKVPLEASGGFELGELAQVAATGVDYISVGALTKHLKATDFSMRLRGN